MYWTARILDTNLHTKYYKGHSKNNEATQKYCMQGIYSAVMAQAA